MATAKKTAKRPVAKTAKRGVPKAAKKKAAEKKSAKTKAAKKTAAKKTAARTARQKPGSGAPAPGPAPSAQGAKGLRVRMYRVGFGDFFLLTVPTGKDRFRHILIDCGVHAKDLGSIQDAVKQMATDCGNELALVIMTHRHADHISGFGTCSDDFSKITVDRVWMPWFENPKDAAATKIQASLTALASQLTAQLAARGPTDPFAAMANNITGGMAAAGLSGNQKALDVLHNGFKNKNPPPVYGYYKAGDQPNLPQDLIDAGFSAQILGPPGDLNLITQLTNTADQYLANATQEDDEVAKTFPTAFRADSYPDHAFKFFAADKVKAMIDGARPDVTAARAQAADKTLNNQSLVILFSFADKNLLFVGDAQWGNWENFLYGGAFGTPGHTEMTKTAKDILGRIDFYKVGHHGSRNATPKDAVAAMMRLGCACMCSTQLDAYNEVPREPLMQALSIRMDGKLARSDQVAATDVNLADPRAGNLPKDFFKTPGKLFIDYNF
jgi:beta-lactamase superfamily II metal-dependent hydrolase